MALARATDDPALKQYYEELALGFVQKAGNEADPDNAAALLAIIKPDRGRHSETRALMSFRQFIRVAFRFVGDVA